MGMTPARSVAHPAKTIRFMSSSRVRATIRTEQMNTLGAYAYGDWFAHVRDRIVGDRGHETVGTGVEMHVRRPAESLDEYDASGESVARRPLGIDHQILGPQAERRCLHRPLWHRAIARQLDPRAVGNEDETVAVALNASLDEVHAGRSNEAGNEAIGR